MYCITLYYTNEILYYSYTTLNYTAGSYILTYSRSKIYESLPLTPGISYSFKLVNNNQI